MYDAWETFRDAGFLAWPILFSGLLGGAAAIVAIARATRRARSAFWIGALALLLGSTCAGLGAFGVIRGRAQTDSLLQADDLRPHGRERVRRVGYLAAQNAAKVGLFFAAFPLLAGAVALLTAPRRKPEQLGAIGFTAFGLMAASFAVFEMRAPVPGREVEVEAAQTELHALVTAVTDDPSDGAVLDKCDALEGTLEDDRYDASREPAFLTAAKCCTLARIAAAKAGGDEGMNAIRGMIERRYFAQHDPELAQMIRDQLTPPPRPEGPTVIGPLSREVIQQTVRYEMPKLRRCYADGAAKNGLAGTVRVHFVIGADGKVTSASTDGSTLADAPTVDCVRRTFEATAFPQPAAAGMVTVIYPLKFVVDDSK